MKNFLAMLRELRVAQCSLAVSWHLHDIERARVGLQKSLDALDRARSSIIINDHGERSSEAPPLYLVKEK